MNNMEYVSYKIDKQIRDKIMIHYASYSVDNFGEYIIFSAKKDDITITIYESKKGYKVLFAGDNVLDEARLFNSEASLKEQKDTIKKEYLDLNTQIGSDEVGFGDFFGPLVVVSALYTPSLQDILDKIKDSKKLDDNFILEFVPTILDRVQYSKLTVRNQKYNEMIDRGYNMNEMKALLHNRALYNLKEKVTNCNSFYIDQFCDEDKYFSYIQFEEKKVTNLNFHTKGESYYPSVALASMISRYYFLKEFEALNSYYSTTFPKGASKTVDKFALEFIDKHGIKELDFVSKKNFINYKNIIAEKK